MIREQYCELLHERLVNISICLLNTDESTNLEGHF